jgi:hypothetical protein
MDRPSSRRALLGAVGTLLLLLFLLPACSDDPILGPTDGESEEGGSYSSLNRLAPPASPADSGAAPSAVPSDPERVNPERF